MTPTDKPTQVGGLPVSLNPIGYVDLASWQADWNAGDAFFTDCQDDDTVPIYTGDQVSRYVELAQANVQALEDTLRTLLAERGHRTDGDVTALAARCLHLSRGDRDLIAMRGSLIDDLTERKQALEARLVALEAENERLNAIINSPQADDFLRAVSTEAEHQRQRWGSGHDGGKTPADWFWLVGYLAGKALHSHASGDTAKAEHHIITTAAACANWHGAMFGRTDMRPGIDAALLESKP